MKIAAIILAAGGSSRLGQPKQLLEFEGETLLARAIRAASEYPTCVVIGSDAERMREEVGNSARVVQNAEWREGLASSIRLGINAIIDSFDGAILLLTDQPRIDAPLLEALVGAQATLNKPIAACRYAKSLGVPALFSKRFFPELLKLRGDTGAKPLLLKHAGEVAVVDFPDGAVDIDSPADLHSIGSLRK